MAFKFFFWRAYSLCTVIEWFYLWNFIIPRETTVKTRIVSCVSGLIPQISVYFIYVSVLKANENERNHIFGKFNSFHSSLKFAMDRFDDSNVHLFEIATDRIDTYLCYKPPYTRSYSSFNSSLPWNCLIPWIKPFFHCAKRICSWKEKFKCQIVKIKLLMSWNGYPSFILAILFSSDLETIIRHIEMR